MCSRQRGSEKNNADSTGLRCAVRMVLFISIPYSLSTYPYSNSDLSATGIKFIGQRSLHPNIPVCVGKWIHSRRNGFFSVQEGRSELPSAYRVEL